MYPAESICAVEGCGHRFDRHEAKWHEQSDEPRTCDDCKVNESRGFETPGPHVFVPRRLAGGALTATDELAAYKRAMSEGQVEAQ